eukprot:scaffold8060_cov391-Pinguiococcus_pyrenoidosus.AAC.1
MGHITAPKEILDFISGCLKFAPDERLSAESALRHPYVAEFHDPEQVWMDGWMEGGREGFLGRGTLLAFTKTSPWFSRCCPQEPVHPGSPVHIPIDDNTKLTAADYRNRLYEEITERRREARRREQQAAKVGELQTPCNALTKIT